MIKKLTIVPLLIFFTTVVFAQAPAIQWQKIYGGSKDDRAYDIQLTPDGGYIVAGETKSNNWDVTGNNNSSNGYYSNNWIVKLTPAGTLQWQKCFGGIEPPTFALTHIKVANSKVIPLIKVIR